MAALDTQNSHPIVHITRSGDTGTGSDAVLGSPMDRLSNCEHHYRPPSMEGEVGEARDFTHDRTLQKQPLLGKLLEECTLFCKLSFICAQHLGDLAH